MNIKPILIVRLPKSIWSNESTRDTIMRVYCGTKELMDNYFIAIDSLMDEDKLQIEHEILNPIHQINLPKPILKIRYNVGEVQLQILKEGFDKNSDYDGYVKTFVPDKNVVGWDIEVLSPVSITIHNSDQFIQNKNNQ